MPLSREFPQVYGTASSLPLLSGLIDEPRLLQFFKVLSYPHGGNSEAVGENLDRLGAAFFELANNGLLTSG